jgi:hypothetical protein
MNLFHRLSLFVLTILFLLMTFIMGIYAFGWLPDNYLPYLIQHTYDNPEFALLATALFLLGVWLLQSLLTHNDEGQTIVQENEMGTVRISTTAVKGMVRQVALDQPGINDVKPLFRMRGKELSIALKLIVSEEAHIPTLSQALSESVKERLQKMAGLTVKEVVVTVTDVEELKKRVSTSVRVR